MDNSSGVLLPNTREWKNASGLTHTANRAYIDPNGKRAGQLEVSAAQICKFQGVQKERIGEGNVQQYVVEKEKITDIKEK